MEQSDGNFIIQLPQRIASYKPDGQKRNDAGDAGGDVSHNAAHGSAQSQYCRGEKHPAGNLYQIAERKQQYKNQQSADLVLENLALQKLKTEIVPQAG